MNDYIKSISDFSQNLKYNNPFKNNKYKELKCSIFCGLIKILIVQPFDFLRFRIQSSEFPVSIKKITLSLINKEGLNTFSLGIPATSFGVLINSLIQFTLYQKFQNIFILKEFDEEVSNSINNLEIFKLMELTHFKNYNNLRNKEKDSNKNTYNSNDTSTNNINIHANKNNDFNYNKDKDYIIIKSDFINEMRRLGKLDKIKYLKEKHNDFNDNNNDSLLVKKYIKYSDYETHCYELHLQKIVKICGISGFLSGIGLAVLTTPIDIVRIKMQSVQNIQKLETKNYINNSTINCIKNTYKDFGIRGFYRAFNLNLAREGIAATFYFSTFEYLKNKEKIKSKKNKIKFYKTFIYGAISGGVNWLITFPIDTVKTKMISDSIIKNRKKYKNSLDCIKKNFRKNGFFSFYSGFSIVFLRGLIVNGTVLSAFDYCRTILIINN
jgi:hypothetical protein